MSKNSINLKAVTSPFDSNSIALKFLSKVGLYNSVLDLVRAATFAPNVQQQHNVSYRLLPSLTTSLWRGWFRQLCCLLVRPNWATNTISEDRQVNAVFRKRDNFLNRRRLRSEKKDTKNKNEIKMFVWSCQVLVNEIG